MNRTITDIVIHESDTPTGRVVTVKDIDSWHRERGWHRNESDRLRFNPGLTSIGYHYVIYLDGSVHTGRDENEIPGGDERVPHGAGLSVRLWPVTVKGQRSGGQRRQSDTALPTVIVTPPACLMSQSSG